MALLDVRDVSKRFGGIAAVDGCSFQVESGSIHGLIGPNGAGKTTLFNIISGFIRPDRGQVLLNGEPITGLRPHQIARRGLRRTFQISRVLGELTVLENLLLHDYPAGFVQALGSSAADPALRRALELLDMVELTHLRHAPAGSLSYGQQKLLEVACLLMRTPRLVLMDEPMAGLNPRMVDRMVALIQRLRQTLGLTFLVVEHAIHVVMQMCDRVVVMAAGRVLTVGPPAVVREDPRVLEAYLGGGAAHAAS